MYYSMRELLPLEQIYRLYVYTCKYNNETDFE